MKENKKSLKYIFSIVFVLASLFISLFSTSMTYIDVYRDIYKDTLSFANSSTARLSTLAERLLFTEKSLINEYISQLDSNRLVKQVLIVSPDNKVIYSNTGSEIGKDYPEIQKYRPNKISNERIVNIQEDDNDFFASKSFVWPALKNQVRSNKLGSVLITVNFQDELSKSVTKEIKIHLFILSFVLGVTGILWFFTCKKILKPLEILTIYSEKTARGEYDNEIPEMYLTEFNLIRRSFIRMIGEIKWKIRSLSESENSFKSLISESPVGIVSFDKNRCLYNTNRTVSDVIGISINAYQGISIEEFICLLKSKSKIITKENNKNFNTENIIKNLSRSDFNLKTHKGRHLKVVNVSINTEKTSRVFYFMDVTNELNLDQMKSEFIARAAHELRTPITSINGYAELLTEMGDKINDRDRFIELIRSESDDVVYLLNELLDLSKIDAGVSEKLNIKPVPVHEFKLMCEAFNYPDDNRKVELEIENGLSYINCDVKRIKQAIKSCLSNAFKFSSQSTSVKCRVSKIIQKTETLIKFEISDNGIGMTDEEASMAFDRFYKADKSGGTAGTGLGLTLVKEIVEMHHGSIRIKSRAGMGTVISIYLPTDLK